MKKPKWIYRLEGPRETDLIHFPRFDTADRQHKYWVTGFRSKSIITRAYPQTVLERLISNGYSLTRYLALEYRVDADRHWFVRESCISHETVDPDMLYEGRNSQEA